MQCGKPVRNIEQEYCHDCAHTRHYYDQGRAVWLHRDPVKQSIYQFKYHNQREYGTYYAREMERLCGDFIRKINPEVLLPVPLHRRKRRKRGYNQAQILAHELGERMGIPVETQMLVRVKNTRPQKKQDHRMRDVYKRQVLRQLIDIQYDRNEMDFKRGTFRVHGDVVEVIPANEADMAVRIEFFGDEIDRITKVDVLTGEIKSELSHVAIFPASHYVVGKEDLERAVKAIEEELEEQIKYFKSEGKLLEAQRISERTNFDIEMMRETGFCSGIENYSRHLTGSEAGQPPRTLLDYFPDDFIMMIDESHKTVPQAVSYTHLDVYKRQSEDIRIRFL